MSYEIVLESGVPVIIRDPETNSPQFVYAKNGCKKCWGRGWSGKAAGQPVACDCIKLENQLKLKGK
jgi:hypothetical protein